MEASGDADATGVTARSPVTARAATVILMDSPENTGGLPFAWEEPGAGRGDSVLRTARPRRQEVAPELLTEGSAHRPLRVIWRAPVKGWRLGQRASTSENRPSLSGSIKTLARPVGRSVPRLSAEDQGPERPTRPQGPQPAPGSGRELTAPPPLKVSPEMSCPWITGL
ncbi:hypothetical protein GCM10010498_30530 [Streptomyces cavourensis]|nr:hypothetical protein GCM10010498_30530 [Streptomyces cavourensis]